MQVADEKLIINELGPNNCRLSFVSFGGPKFVSLHRYMLNDYELNNVAAQPMAKSALRVDFSASIDLMQLTSSPQVTKCETDGGRKSGYFAVIFSGKNDRGLWSLTQSSLQAPSSSAQEVILHLHPKCTRFQQDLTLTKVNKRICMPH